MQKKLIWILVFILSFLFGMFVLQPIVEWLLGGI